MIIVRDNKPIQLTLEEMGKIYDEMQLMYDMKTVANYASWYIEDKQELEQFLANRGLIKEMAKEYRDLETFNCGYWSTCVAQAFENLYTKPEEV